MKTWPPIFIRHSSLRRPLLLKTGLLATLLAVALLLLAGCGGCPWTRVSEVTITPPTPCLKLAVAEQGRGGCVNPELQGTNDCAMPLTILIPDEQQTAYYFESGQAVSVVIDLALARREHDTYYFELSTQLGEQDLQISFHTYLERRSLFDCLLGPVFIGLVLLGALGIVVMAVLRGLSGIVGSPRNQ